MNKSIIIIFFLLAFTITSRGQSKHSKALQSFLNKAEETGALIGCEVINANTGSVILSHHANANLIPASVGKLWVTLAAIDLLKPDFSYNTELSYWGTIAADGTLLGDLVLKGSGDPSLATAVHDQQNVEQLSKTIALAIKNAGIRCVDGSLVMDLSAFDPLSVNDYWTYDDLTNYYASGTHAINVAENAITLGLSRSSHIGHAVQLAYVRPDMPDMTWDCQVTTAAKGTGDQAYVFGDPYGKHRQIRGTIPVGKTVFEIRAAAPDPASGLARSIQEKLQKLDIKINDIQYTQKPKLENGNPKRTLITRITSPTILQLVKKANRESNNLYCESFLKTIDQNYPNAASYDGGKKTLDDHVRKIGLGTHAYQMVDGSGLSPRNRLNAHAMNQWLHHYYQLWGQDALTDLLPQCGYEGSVKYFLHTTPWKGRAWLKSGSMSGVISYSGIIDHPVQGPMIVTILVNGHHVKNSTMRNWLVSFFDNLYSDM